MMTSIPLTEKHTHMVHTQLTHAAHNAHVPSYFVMWL